MKSRFFCSIALLITLVFSNCQKEDFTSIISTGLKTEISSYAVGVVLAENGSNHEEATDYQWDESDLVEISLNGNTISCNSQNVEINGTVATIISGGVYSISGTLSNGQIQVEADDEDTIWIIFNGVNITNATSAPVYIANAEKTIVVLADGKENFLEDGNNYIFETEEEDEPNATLFSKDDLTITGNGELTITANYADGITSKDGLIISSGTIIINSEDDAIRGKDYLIIKTADLSITANGDGLKSDNDDDGTYGYIYIQDGEFNINSGADAIQGNTDVLIEAGTFDIISGGGGNSTTNSSTKGLKAGVHIIIDGGTFEFSTADDAIHCNNNLCINEGAINISSNDDAIHADSTLCINGGDILITKSYEGIESMIIVINSGNIQITSSDDGLNVAGGNDGSASGNFPGGSFESSSEDFIISINGGFIAIYASGDGIDANGSIEMTDGTVLIHGPTAHNNSALDYDITFNISGGELIAVGSANMAQAPGNSSDQYSVKMNFNSTNSAETLIHIRSSSGTEIMTFKPDKNYQSVVYSSSSLSKGTNYSIYKGGSHSGTPTNGLYVEGAYTPGSKYTDFKISDKVTILY